MENIDESDVNKKISMMLSVLSHDLKTPLSIVIEGAEILLKVERFKVTNAEQREILQMIQSNGNYLLEMINDVGNISLALGRSDFSVKKSCINAYGPIEDSIKGSARLRSMETKNIGIEVDGKPYTDGLEKRENKEVKSDAYILRRALTNIVSNASKHTKDWIGIDVSEREEADIISVSDNGSGVPAGEDGNIFKPFYQAKNAKGGSGLGLYIAKKIAEGHGGDLVLDRGYTGGSRFTVSLPKQ